jgi:hypothetical protein
MPRKPDPLADVKGEAPVTPPAVQSAATPATPIPSPVGTVAPVPTDAPIMVVSEPPPPETCWRVKESKQYIVNGSFTWLHRGSIVKESTHDMKAIRAAGFDLEELPPAP